MTSPRPPRVQLFVNPRAGRWGRRQAEALRTAFEDAGATAIVCSCSAGPLTVAPDVDHVCGVGGDGTIRHVVAALEGDPSRPSISVYPLGTVNLLARECGYVARPADFVHRALALPARRRHYIARVNGTPMLTCASIGPDSWTVDRVSPLLKRVIGRWAYVAAFVRLLASWPRHQITVVADRRELRCEALYVAKGRYFAGPWRLAPAATLEDPLLHVVALPSCSRRAFARFAWSVFRGRNPPGVIRFTCTGVRVEADVAIPVQADGDIVATLPVAMAIVAEPLIFS